MTPGEISVVAEMVRRRSGVRVEADKVYLIESRLGPIARRQGFTSISELISDLQARRDETMIWAVVEAMASAETQFFRDRTPFDHLGRAILPGLARRGRPAARLWSAGCATGQEPYSLAMLQDEERGRLQGLPVEILATDLSERGLEKAQAGIYTQFEVQRGLPSRLLIRHFDKVDEHWVLSGRIRQAVRFERRNLLDAAPEGPWDVVLLRHVIGAFEPLAARSVLERVAAVLAPEGLLILGAGEDPAAHTAAFRPVAEMPGVYARDPGFRAAA